ncbi:N-6 DNA methylase [Abyssicoccus albus]|uniref:Adenine-specific DNA-methyltransferase n=1 Tax=Abyssicoccus albus TaxID=1817405 RepID=A0A3N5CK66_9BACL|nr:N-6 DNA methylase [Abyssicoccus albus]RPF58211.1 adenine-specific DNA-methyltransferase [Abyssicoccus albus]
MKINQSADKLRGGYYTPPEITKFIYNYIKEDSMENFTVLEPSIGDGAFINDFKEGELAFNMVGIELIKEEANKARQLILEDDRFNVINIDFYEYYKKNKEKKYNYVVGNPPYIRYQYLSQEQRDYQSEILTNNGMKPNKLINAWVAFTVASIEMLEEDGVMLFVLPTDLLQVNYAKELRKLFNDRLSELTIINFEKTVFNNIQQDVLLIVGKKKIKKEEQKHKLKIVNLTDISKLKMLNIREKPFVLDELKNYYYETDKWSSVFIDNNHKTFYLNLRKDNLVSYFNDYIKGEVGITTGNNKVFAINDTILKKYELEEYAIPLLGRSVEVKGITYDSIDFEENKKANKNVWLLDFNNKELKGKAINYIEEMVKAKEHIGYKLSLRDRWYEVPSIWNPDAFLLRRIGEGPKIILNDLDATSTDTFHRLKIKKGVNSKLVIFALYSSLALMTFELEGRIFGGGALEILPGDLKNIFLPKIDFYSFNKYETTLFDELDNKLRSNESLESIVLWVNQNLIKHFNVDEDILHISNDIWKSLKDKRTKK